MKGLRRGICEPFGCPRTAGRLMVLKGIMLFIVGGVLARSNMHVFSCLCYPIFLKETKVIYVHSMVHAVKLDVLLFIEEVERCKIIVSKKTLI